MHNLILENKSNRILSLSKFSETDTFFVDCMRAGAKISVQIEYFGLLVCKSRRIDITLTVFLN